MVHGLPEQNKGWEHQIAAWLAPFHSFVVRASSIFLFFAVAGYCCRCKTRMASYYCDVCHLFDNDPSHLIFHCEACGICRRGERDKYTHCQVCQFCVPTCGLDRHKCFKNASHNDWSLFVCK